MRWWARVFFPFWCLCLIASVARGQETVAFELVIDRSDVQHGSSFSVMLRARLEPGWHLYSMELPVGGPIPTKIWVEENEAFLPAGPPSEPPPIPWFDENFGMETSYFEDTVDFEVPVLVKETAPLANHDLIVKIRFMVCNDTSCLPPQTKTLTERLNVSGEGGHVDRPSPGPIERADSVGSAGLPAGTWAYIWFAITMGALALLTPCVFPMIPITVSYFTKRNARTRGRAIFEAAVYSLGIIATFTLIGFALTFLFGAGGINRLAASPVINGLIALIFVVFALSLFGVIELRLPSSWLSAVDKKSSESSGIVGILLMSLTFSLTSFTCTVPLWVPLWWRP